MSLFSKESVNDILNKIKSIDIASYATNFSESDFGAKVKSFGKQAGITLMYPILLLYNLAVNDAVPFADKAKIVGALGYFILPIDLIPDTLIGIGFTDDIAVAMLVLKSVAGNISMEILTQTKNQLKEMFGKLDPKELSKIEDLINKEQKK